MRSAALIYNPRAGSWRTSRLVAEIESALVRAGYTIAAQPTVASGHATDLAKEAAVRGFDAVFAFGGDGTVREVAAGLLGTGVVLTPIPGGTVNVVSTALGFPPHPRHAAEAVTRGRVVEMDVGLCGEEVFLMQASAGLDAAIMAGLRPRLKRRFGRLAVMLSGLHRWFTYEYPRIDLVADERSLSASLVAVCNLPYYGGSRPMAPCASACDRRLDLVLFRGGGRRETLAFAKDFLLGRHSMRDDVETISVEQVELRGPAGLSVQADGDPLSVELPVTVRLAPERLRVTALADL